jgi:hypothetical protein
MRRPIIEPSPQLQLSTIISTSKPSCCCLPGASSTAANGSAHQPSHLSRHSNPHSGVRGNLSALAPRVRSLAAFGRRPPVNVAQLPMAGIRNPAHFPPPTIVTNGGWTCSESGRRWPARGEPAHASYWRAPRGRPRCGNARHDLPLAGFAGNPYAAWLRHRAEWGRGREVLDDTRPRPRRRRAPTLHPSQVREKSRLGSRESLKSGTAPLILIDMPADPAIKSDKGAQPRRH